MTALVEYNLVFITIFFQFFIIFYILDQVSLVKSCWKDDKTMALKFSQSPETNQL